MHWSSGNRRVLPGTGVSPLFCPCMVLWHLGWKQVEASWADRQGSYYYNEMVMRCRAIFVPLLKLNQLAPVFL